MNIGNLFSNFTFNKRLYKEEEAKKGESNWFNLSTSRSTVVKEWRPSSRIERDHNINEQIKSELDGRKLGRRLSKPTGDESDSPPLPSTSSSLREVCDIYNAYRQEEHFKEVSSGAPSLGVTPERVKEQEGIPCFVIKNLLITIKHQVQFSLTADAINKPTREELIARYTTLKAKIEKTPPQYGTGLDAKLEQLVKTRMLRFCDLGIELANSFTANPDYKQWAEYMTFALRCIIGGQNKYIDRRSFLCLHIPESITNSPFDRFLQETFRENIEYGKDICNFYGNATYYAPFHEGRKYERYLTQHANCGEISKRLSTDLQQLQSNQVKINVLPIEQGNHMVLIITSDEVGIDFTKRVSLNELKEYREEDLYIVDLWMSLIKPDKLNSLDEKQRLNHPEFGFLGSAKEYEQILNSNKEVLISSDVKVPFTFEPSIILNTEEV